MVSAAIHIHREVRSHRDEGVLSIPRDDAARFRVLGRHVRELFEGIDELKPLVEKIGLSRRTMQIDELACVFTGASVSDFHFALDMKEGRRVLLITDDIPMMARFIAAYLIRRLECDPELAAHL